MRITHSETNSPACQVNVTKLLVGVDGRKIRLSGDWESLMYSRMQFAALELMCRERAALAKKQMEYALFE